MEKLARVRDEWIALRCQSGDPGGFEQLVTEMERPLLYYATKLIGDVQTALDVVQDVWIVVFGSIRKLNDPGSLRPWLYRITHGIAVDHIRQDISRDKAEKAQAEGFTEAVEPSFSNFDCAALHRALNDLAIKHREVLTLHFLEDFSLTEIAQIVGSSEGTVKSRLHYAKKALRQALLRGGYANTR